MELSDHVVDEYRTKYNKEPKFSYRNVDFGLEDDEVSGYKCWLLEVSSQKTVGAMD